MLLLDLPDCMLEQIFDYLSYDDIAKKRLVSVRINKLCQGMLNIGFNKMIRRHGQNLKRIKALLPRRESERRTHTLAKHSDILTCIETRISMLSMTYKKYMDVKLCCFIPGKIIDEVLQILVLINSATKPLRSHEVLQELRDISSMAIDHFDDKIAPQLKKSSEYHLHKPSASLYQSESQLGLHLSLTSYHTTVTVPPGANDSQLLNAADYGSLDMTGASGVASTSTPQLEDQRSAQRLAINRLDKKCDIIMKKLKCIISMQKRQSRHIRNNSIQISELKTEMLEFRRRMENSNNNTAAPASSSAAPPVESLPQPSSAPAATKQKAKKVLTLSPPSNVERTHASSSSESIEVVSRSSASSASSTLSPDAISSSGGSTPAVAGCIASSSSSSSSTPMGAFSNIKPRTATILLKRRLHSPSEERRCNAMRMRYDIIDTDSE